MISVTLSWVADQLQGKLQGEDNRIKGVSTDSRNIQPGDLFIALVGPNFDGHQFAKIAEEKGASALMISRPVDTSLPCVVVEDTRIGLGKLGAAVKAEVQPQTIAITGSSGKTTVKEMVAAILGRRGKVLATAGNFNNDIGVPLTLLNLEADHEYAVVELGANHLGEIAYTTKLVQPDVATVINAGAAHLEGFGSLLGVARAKSEIFKGLSQHKLAIINQDSQFSDFWKGKLDRQKCQTFSLDQDSDFKAEEVTLNLDGCAQFDLVTPQGKIYLTLPVPGMHNVSNALVAAALAMGVGASLEDIKLGLPLMAQAGGRLNVKQLTNQVKILDDTYNANVASVNAAIDLLASFSGRRILVLGDMGELGEKARYYHQQVGEYAKESKIDNLYTLGVLSQSASEAFNGRGCHFSDMDELMERIISDIGNEKRDISILVKGSRSAKMERVVVALEASPVGKLERVRERLAC